MAMNKTERAALESAQKELVVARALNWSRHESLLEDLPPPSGRGPGTRYTEGWGFNSHTEDVFPMWSGVVVHGYGSAPTTTMASGSRSHGGRALYSTKLLALQALRYEMERNAARALAKIDAQIAAQKDPS